MLSWALIFFVVAIIAAVFGFGGIDAFGRRERNFGRFVAGVGVVDNADAPASGGGRGFSSDEVFDRAHLDLRNFGAL